MKNVKCYLNPKGIVNWKRFFPRMISLEEIGRDVPGTKKSFYLIFLFKLR